MNSCAHSSSSKENPATTCCCWQGTRVYRTLNTLSPTPLRTGLWDLQLESGFRRGANGSRIFILDVTISRVWWKADHKFTTVCLADCSPSRLSSSHDICSLWSDHQLYFFAEEIRLSPPSSFTRWHSTNHLWLCHVLHTLADRFH